MEQINKEELERAAKRIMEMNNRANKQGAVHKMPPVPSFVNIPNLNTARAPEDSQKNTAPLKPDTQKSGNSLFNLINFKNIFVDSDRSLLAGIMMLLGGEAADEKLMLALLYIML